jgi:hypothetical protein
MGERDCGREEEREKEKEAEMMFDTKKEYKELVKLYGAKGGKRAFCGMMRTSRDYLKRHKK